MSAQHPSGHLPREGTTLRVVRDQHGAPVVEPLMVGGHARITTASSIRCDYATHYAAAPDLDPAWAAGGKDVRFTDWHPRLVSARTLADALARLLVVVDPCLVRGVPVVFGGVPFPYLAFAEFIESLLRLGFVVEGVLPTTRAIDVVDRYVFDPCEAHVDAFATLLAGDWAGFFVVIEHRYCDPAWLAFERQRYPGHADLFLSSIRRRHAYRIAAGLPA